MKSSMDQRVQVKVFLGYLLTPEIRTHLNQSDTWKQSMITWQSEEGGIREIHHEGKSYIGIYINQITMDELRNLEIELKETVASQCSELNSDLLKIRIFPQLFVS